MPASTMGWRPVVTSRSMGSAAGWHLTALAAKDGRRLWDTTLRPLFAVDQIDALTVTAQYAHIQPHKLAEIYDAATGKLIGTVGNESYR